MKIYRLKAICVPLFMLLSGASLFGQTNLTATPLGGPAADGTAVVNLILSTVGSSAPAGLQWKLSYGPDVTSVSVNAGPGIATAKTVTCSPGSGSLICVGYGVNDSVIGNGIIAQVTVKI